jgi:hypothetical protein
VFALPTCALHTRPGAFCNPNPFLLRNPCRDSQHQFPGRPCGSKVCFGIRFKFHAERDQLSDVLKRLEHAFASEPIQSPNQHDIEGPSRRILKQPPECLPISGFARNVIFVHADDSPSLTRCIFA